MGGFACVALGSSGRVIAVDKDTQAGCLFPFIFLFKSYSFLVTA
jgi:hypothetical protein